MTTTMNNNNNEERCRIWIDGDACPAVIRDIIYRAALRTRQRVTFVANHAFAKPDNPYVRLIHVMGGFDKADDEIIARVQPGDLVVTQDIPLAAEVLEKGAQCVSPRGEMFDVESIKARLGMRDFMDTLRGSGIHGGGPKPLTQSDRLRFANVLDGYLTQLQTAARKHSSDAEPPDMT
jgi:hypothetical protein